MFVKVIEEHGYESAMLGMSLSYNSTIERSKEIAESLAFKGSGHGKFLESIITWLDITAPRFWHQEFDTYRVGITKQSESTLHTITKKELTLDNFEYPIYNEGILEINYLIKNYKECKDVEEKNRVFLKIKNRLPEGFLQRRICMLSYKTLQNMYQQRIKHRLPQWQYFLNTVMSEIEHPEFIHSGDK